MSKDTLAKNVTLEDAVVHYAVVYGEGQKNFEGDKNVYKVAVEATKDVLKTLKKALKEFNAAPDPKKWVKDYNGTDVIWFEQDITKPFTLEQDEGLDLSEKDAQSIGAGSVGDVVVRLYEYEYRGKEGVGRALNGFLIKEFVKYTQPELNLGGKKLGGLPKPKKDKKKKKKK